MLVGEVVADEHRRASRERRFVEEGRDRIALVGALRAQFDQVVAGLQVIAGQPRQRLDRERLQVGGGFRHRPPVQADRLALVLEQRLRITRQQFARMRLDVVQRAWRFHVRRRIAARRPALQAVHAGGREAQRIEQAVEHVDPAAADQRQRAVQRHGKGFQPAHQVRGHHHPLGMVGELHQRAVDVEEQRPAIGQRRWRRQGGSAVG